jgi:hypothetical protein
MSLPANFPTSLDALANPSATTNRDDPGFELDLVVARIHDILEALEAKMGVGASLPSAPGVLRRTAPGVTGWGQIATADITPGAIPMTLIASFGPLVTPQSTFSFTGIPSTYRNLRLVLQGRTTSGNSADEVVCRFNNNTTTVYYNQLMQGIGSGVSAAESLSQTFIAIIGVPGGAATGSTAGGCVADIVDAPLSGVFAKYVNILGGAEYSNATGGRSVRVGHGVFFSGVGISQIDLTPIAGQWANGSYVALFGY